MTVHYLTGIKQTLFHFAQIYLIVLHNKTQNDT